MLQILPSCSEKWLAVNVSDSLSFDDFNLNLSSVLDARFKQQKNLQLWLEFEHDFQGISVDGITNEVIQKLFQNYSFEKVAIISDDEMVKMLVESIANDISYSIKAFCIEDKQLAVTWLESEY